MFNTGKYLKFDDNDSLYFMYEPTILNFLFCFIVGFIMTMAVCFILALIFYIRSKDKDKTLFQQQVGISIIPAFIIGSIASVCSSPPKVVEGALKAQYQQYGYTFTKEGKTDLINGIPYTVAHYKKPEDSGIFLRSARANEGIYVLLLDDPHESYDRRRPETVRLTPELQKAVDRHKLEAKPDVPNFFKGEDVYPQGKM